MEIVRVVVHVGLQLVGLKEALAPEGSPEALNVTPWLVPEERVAVMVLVTDWPRVTVLAPPFDNEKSKPAVLFTVKPKLVVFVKLPAVPVTVMVELPVGVVAEVEIVNVVEQLGLQLVGLKEAVAPEGSPEALNDTA